MPSFIVSVTIPRSFDARGRALMPCVRICVVRVRFLLTSVERISQLERMSSRGCREVRTHNARFMFGSTPKMFSLVSSRRPRIAMPSHSFCVSIRIPEPRLPCHVVADYIRLISSFSPNLIPFLTPYGTGSFFYQLPPPPPDMCPYFFLSVRSRVEASTSSH